MSPRPNNVAPRDLPTTSLYMQDSLQEIDWEGFRTGPFSFLLGDRLIIVRYATGEEIALARSISAAGGKIIYLIDDDLEAIVADQQLPKDYRSRIGVFLSGPWQDLKTSIAEVIVSSPALADTTRRQGFESVTQLDPYWPIPSANFSEAADPGAPVRIAWLCTRSHIADLDSISGDLEKFLSRHGNARLTVFFGKACPAWIKKNRQIKNLNPLPWPEYRQWLSGQQFDIALYPLLQSEVNRSRSINKFLEHAVAGAASILSENTPFLDRLQPGDCLIAGTEDWGDHLEALFTDHKQITEIAGQARSRAREIADAARLRQIEFWNERLPILRESQDRPDHIRD